MENFNEETLRGTGFKFHEATASALIDTIAWATYTYDHNEKAMKTLMRRAMSKRFTWEEAARKYEALYRLAVKRRMAAAP